MVFIWAQTHCAFTELSYVVAWDTRLGCAHSKTSHYSVENRKTEMLRLSLIARRQQLTAAGVFPKYGDRSGNRRRIKIRWKDDDRGRNVWCGEGKCSVADGRVVERAKKILEKSVVDRNRRRRRQRRNEPHTFVAPVSARAYLNGPRAHPLQHIINIIISL